VHKRLFLKSFFWISLRPMKIQRHFKAILLAVAVILYSPTHLHAQENTAKFTRKELYAAMASSNVANVDNQLNTLKNTDVKDKDAYEGALTMKKAGLVKGAGKKLKLFKDGHNKLEAAISRDKDNGELRFLRLMIQEHAPGMLHYKSDLDKDSAYIRQSFKKLPVDVQQAITSYSKTSKVLRPEDF
jgi:hypothetical protein